MFGANFWRIITIIVFIATISLGLLNIFILCRNSDLIDKDCCRIVCIFLLIVSCIHCINAAFIGGFGIKDNKSLVIYVQPNFIASIISVIFYYTKYEEKYNFVYENLLVELFVFYVILSFIAIQLLFIIFSLFKNILLIDINQEEYRGVFVV